MKHFFLTALFILGVQTPKAGEGWSGSFIATAYLPNCTGTFRTATGKYADPEKMYVAVDPKVIPLGSTVCIESMGCYSAEDTGGKIKGRRLDILMKTKKEAFAWGVRKVTATVYPKSKNPMRKM